MGYVDRFVREEDLLGEVMEELERVRPKFNNEQLVICNNDHMFSNRFWAPFGVPNDPIDYDRDVLVRSSVLCKNLGKFSKLKRLMINEISFAQLRRLEEIKELETLEIGVLTVDDSTAMFNVPLKLPMLKHLFVDKYTGKLLPSVPFQTPRLKAISFGTEAINHIRFYQHSVTHIEFERGGRIDCPLEDLIYDTFPDLKHLVCNTYLDPTIRGSVNELMKRLPFLAELHCNFERRKSVTQPLFTETAEQIRKVIGELSSMARFANNPVLEVYVQGIPLAQYEAFDNDQIKLSQLEMQKALRSPELPVPTFQEHGSLVHVELRALCHIEPKLTRCRKVLDQFNRRFPNLQRVDIDMSGREESFDCESVIEILESLRSVSVMSFMCPGFSPRFYQCVLPNMPCLVNSLVLMRLFEPQHRNLMAAMDYSFLQHLRKLRAFETNIVRKDAILDVILQPDHHPVRFAFRFNAVDSQSDVEIRKIASDRFEMKVTEKRTVKGKELQSTIKIGTLSAAQLDLKLVQDPVCERLLKHPFDYLKPAEIKEMPRKYMEEGLRAFRSRQWRKENGMSSFEPDNDLKRSWFGDRDPEWAKVVRQKRQKRTQASTSQPSQASTSQPSQASTSQPTEARTSQPSQASTSRPAEPTQASTSRPAEQMEASTSRPAEQTEAKQPNVVCLDGSEEEYSSDDDLWPIPVNNTAAQPTRNDLQPAQPSSARAPAQQATTKATQASVQTNGHVPTAPAAQPAQAAQAAGRPQTVPATGPAQTPATAQANGPAQMPATAQTATTIQTAATIQAAATTQTAATTLTTKPATAQLLTYPKSLHSTTFSSQNPPVQSAPALSFTVQFPPQPASLRSATNSYQPSAAPRTSYYQQSVPSAGYYQPSATPRTNYYQQTAPSTGYYVPNTLPGYYAAQPIQAYSAMISPQWPYQLANPYYPTSTPVYSVNNGGYPVVSPAYPASSYGYPSATSGYTPTSSSFQSRLNLPPWPTPVGQTAAPAANPSTQPAPAANPTGQSAPAGSALTA